MWIFPFVKFPFQYKLNLKIIVASCLQSFLYLKSNYSIFYLHTHTEKKKRHEIVLQTYIFLLVKRWIYRHAEAVDPTGFKFSSVFNGSCQTIGQPHRLIKQLEDRIRQSRSSVYIITEHPCEMTREYFKIYLKSFLVFHNLIFTN